MLEHHDVYLGVVMLLVHAFIFLAFLYFWSIFCIYFKNQKQDRRPQIPKNKVYLKYKQLRFKINIYQTRDIFQHLTKMS